MDCRDSNKGGSPPRGRGKVDTISNNSRARRITPAWAGKSSLCHLCALGSGDHPRVGGEKRMKKSRATETKGSPPRGRGKVTDLRELAAREGITPAWAGKSNFVPIEIEGAEDHPRVGGEKLETGYSTICCSGSPPRGRGKVQRACPDAKIIRITPAWAGKSQYHLVKVSGGGDHPRVGGEKAFTISTMIVGKGSPPRGRGKAERAPRIDLPARITPAWAGKRLQRRLFLSVIQDHPRVGGEKTKKIP